MSERLSGFRIGSQGDAPSSLPAVRLIWNRRN